MQKILFSVIIAICLLSLSHPCFARKKVTVAFGDALPPWVIPSTDEGILLDIIKQALEPAGYKINPVYVPYARRLISYKARRVDAVCDINPNIIQDSALKGYFTGIVYAYENIGVSLTKKGFHFARISDLADHSLVSWQGARAAIGGEYARMAEKNPRYREVANQKTQVLLLYLEREEVIQLDRQIFRYFRKKVAEEAVVDTTQPIDIFPLFGKNECGFLFRDQEAQTAFKENFIQLKQSGKYDQIFFKYTE